MMADPTEQRALLRVKRKNLFVCAALLLGAFTAHGLAGGFSLALALTYLGWCVSFLAIGVAVGVGWIPVTSTGLWTGPVTLGAMTALIHLTGGPRSPCFPMLGSLPFAIAIFSPDTRRPTVLASVS